MRLALFDTDILSGYLRSKNVILNKKVNRYLRIHNRLSMSAVTIYQYRRHLIIKDALTQIQHFSTMCEDSEIFPISQPILDIATNLWVDSRRRGLVLDDADLFIAATALHHQYRLITGNTAHFDWIPKLDVEDWQND